MEEKIKKMYYGDCVLIFVFILFLWLVLVCVMSAAAKLAPDHAVRVVALLTGAVAGVSATWALIAVLVHLKKNRLQLYAEDLRCLQGKDV